MPAFGNTMVASRDNTYNALNGAEIQRLLLEHLRKIMELDYRFRQSVSYPVVKLTWSLKVEAALSQPTEWSEDVVVFFANQAFTEDSAQPPVLVLDGEENVDGVERTPDHAREELLDGAVVRQRSNVGVFEQASRERATLGGRRPRVATPPPIFPKVEAPQ